MPYVIHPRIRTSLARLGMISAAGTLAAAASLAGGGALAGGNALAAAPGSGASVSQGSCPTQPVTQAFAPFGDTSAYRLAPGGSFEGHGAGRWHTVGARLVRANEPWKVAGAGTRSLAIAAGGTAVSPVFCADTRMPTFRFFLRQITAGSGLQVTVLPVSDSRRAAHGAGALTAIADGSQATWGPSAQLPLASALGLTTGEHVLARLRFHVPRGGGRWQIDDVLLDPYRVADGE